MPEYLSKGAALGGQGFRPPPAHRDVFLFGPRRRRRTTFRQACHVVWACGTMAWTQAQAAHVIGLHPSTVNDILHGRLFPTAYPIALPPLRGRMPANDNQPSFDF